MSAKIIYRLNKLHQMIVEKKTGTPAELSKKIKVSERQIRNYIGILKEMGSHIGFCRKSQSYYYKKEVFNIEFGYVDDRGNEE
ncbi:HTH domain-containing protein [Niabella sp. 22666]|uniref:HTH domain-containing protein n=1 Tax=Niabella sp. 22666 TaxID=3453954 RepID=UPI003F87C2E1